MAKKAAKGTRKGKKPTTGAKRDSTKTDRRQAAVLRRPAAHGKSAHRTALSSVADLLAIEQLLHRYCHVLDRGSVDEIAELFHRDAVLLPVYESDDRYVGRDAVRGWYTNYLESFRPSVRYLRHRIESPLIEISGDSATSVCYLDADAINLGSDEPMVFVGRYDDKFIKDEGRWWFKERKIIAYYIYSAGEYLEGRGAAS